MDENGQLKIVQNVNELYEVWNELKEDEINSDSNSGKCT